ncbi:MAG: radical SAM protein [Nitrospirae bacterium]|nr:radical SAM protein [Nitrospirota bacterium]
MYSLLRHSGSIFWKKRAIHLTFFVTRKCNLKCPFCFYLSGERGSRVPENELSLEEIGRISRSMGSLLWLAFSGGEVFLRDDLEEISEIFYKNNKPAIMLFPTNSMLPDVIREKTERIVKRCKKSIIAVKLSLDGMRERHDELRGRKGSFEKTMATYRLLEGLVATYPHFELGINTVFCSENQNEMDGIIDFVLGLKNVKTHTISLVRGDATDKAFKKVDYAKYLAAIERLEENLRAGVSSTYRFRGARIKAAQDILQRRLIHRTAAEKKQLIPCYAGRLNLVLTEGGDLYPCEILSEPLGNVRKQGYDIGGILRSEQAENVIRSIRSKACYCTHECYFMTNILFNPRLYPSLAKEYLKL